MPELPEVERARRLLAEHCISDEIVGCNCREQGGGPRDSLFDDIVMKARENDMIRSFVSTQRRGKQMWLTLSGKGPEVLLHFGMTGNISVKGVDSMLYQSFTVDAVNWPPRFCKLELVFKSGKRVAFTDPRRLGRVLLRGKALKESPIKDLAPDAFREPPEWETWRLLMLSRNKPVKAVLLDQNMIISGLGNWLADEILYQACVHPSAMCSSLSDPQLEQIREKMIHICTYACEVNADSSQFPKHWIFHSRWGKGKETPVMPNGDRVVFETHGGRTSAIVTKVQHKGQRTQADTFPKERKRGGNTAKATSPSKEKTVKKEEPDKETESKPKPNRKRKKAPGGAAEGPIRKPTTRAKATAKR